MQTFPVSAPSNVFQSVQWDMQITEWDNDPVAQWNPFHDDIDNLFAAFALLH